MLREFIGITIHDDFSEVFRKELAPLNFDIKIIQNKSRKDLLAGPNLSIRTHSSSTDFRSNALTALQFTSLSFPKRILKKPFALADLASNHPKIRLAKSEQTHSKVC